MLQLNSNYVIETFKSRKRYQVWFWQISYWLFVSVIGFFTLTLWYGDLRWPFIVHTLLQSIVGLAASFILYFLFIGLWHQRVLIRFTLGISVVLLIALLWTYIRLKIFISLTQFHDLWSDFGGWYYASIFIFLCWTGLFHGLRYYHLLESEHKIMLKAEAEARTEQIKRIKAQSEAKEAQLTMLRYQLTPHFLCNTLNAINALIEIQQTDKAQQMTIQLSKFLRFSLDHNPHSKVSLEQEIETLNLYLNIEKSRFADRLKIYVNIEDNALCAGVPSLLLQPIIENSMKHAISQNEDGGLIQIEAHIDHNKLVLEVTDSGPSTKKPKHGTQHKGIGLQNIQERLSVLYDGKFHYESHFLITGGLKTVIRLPYEQLLKS